MKTTSLIVSLILLHTLSFAAAEPKLSELKGVWRSDFNEDSSRVIVQMRGGDIGLWNTLDGKPLAGEIGVLHHKGRYVIDGKFRQALLGFKTGGARVFDLNTGKAVSPLMDITLSKNARPSPTVFTPDGSRVLVVDTKENGRVFEVKSGLQVATLDLPPMSEDREVNSNPTFSKDGKWAFVLDSTASLHRYNTRTWKESAPPMRHPNREKFHSCGFAISDDARYAVTFDAPGENGPDGQLQLWNVTTSQPINAPLSAQNGLSARFMNGGRRLLITPGRGNTRVVKLPSLETDFVLPRHDDVEASRALITTDGRSILTWGYDSRLILTDAVTGKYQGSSHNRARIQSAHTGPDPDFVWLTYDNTAFLLKGHYDCYVVRMDLKTMKPTAIVRVTDYLHRTILSRDGTRLMIHKGKTDHEVIRIFNAETLTD